MIHLEWSAEKVRQFVSIGLVVVVTVVVVIVAAGALAGTMQSVPVNVNP